MNIKRAHEESSLLTWRTKRILKYAEINTRVCTYSLPTQLYLNTYIITFIKFYSHNKCENLIFSYFSLELYLMDIDRQMFQNVLIW